MSIKKNNQIIAGAVKYANFTDFNSIVKSIGASFIGTERMWRGNSAPKNYLIENGQLVSRNEYIDLYNWVVENNLIISDDEWQNDKKYGFYSYGDGSTTFRLPDLRGYYFVGYDSAYHTGLGVHQNDTLPNINGTFNIVGTNESTPISSTTNGVFKVNTKPSQGYPITGSTTLTDNVVENIELDISDKVTVGDRVQPRSLPVNFVVCYKNLWDN